MLVFAEGGKPGNMDKNSRSKARSNNKLNPHITPYRIQTQATLVGGECSHHLAMPAPQCLKMQITYKKANKVKQTDKQAKITTKCPYSHGGWTAKTVIWNMKEFLHFILVHLSAGSIMSGGWK